MLVNLQLYDHNSYMYCIHVLLAAEGGSIEPVEPPRYGPAVEEIMFWSFFRGGGNFVPKYYLFSQCQWVHFCGCTYAQNAFYLRPELTTPVTPLGELTALSQIIAIPLPLSALRASIHGGHLLAMAIPQPRFPCLEQLLVGLGSKFWVRVGLGLKKVTHVQLCPHSLFEPPCLP